MSMSTTAVETPRTEGPSTPLNEVSIRTLVRKDLPSGAFAARPLRTLWFVPLAGSIVLLSTLLAAGTFAWRVGVPIALLLVHQYGCIFFFGHELSHGAMTRSRRLQDVLLFFSYLIFALPLFPRLPSDHAPLVRQSLVRHAGPVYLSPPLWKALLAVFLTPRIYQSVDTLVDPLIGRTVTISQVEAALRQPGIRGLLQLSRWRNGGGTVKERRR